MDSTGGAAENANGTFGTDLLRGTLRFSGGATDLARWFFFRGESGGVFLGTKSFVIRNEISFLYLGILEVVGLLTGSIVSAACSAPWVDSSTPLSASPSAIIFTLLLSLVASYFFIF